MRKYTQQNFYTASRIVAWSKLKVSAKYYLYFSNFIIFFAQAWQWTRRKLKFCSCRRIIVCNVPYPPPYQYIFVQSRHKHILFRATVVSVRRSINTSALPLTSDTSLYYQHPIVELIVVVASLLIHIVANFVLYIRRRQREKNPKARKPVPLAQKINRIAG